MAEKKHFGDCPECGAPCEVIETSYIEEGHEVHFVENKYSRRGAGWVEASERLPLHKAFWNIEDGYKKDCSFPVRISGAIYGMAELFDNRQEGALAPIYYLVFNGDDYYEDQFHIFEWLDESPAEQPVVKQINREWINHALVEFALWYHKTPNKDIANDSCEYLNDKLKEAGVEYILLDDEKLITAAEQPGREVAIAFAEWLNSNFVSIENKDGEAAYVEYSPQEYDKKQQFKISQLWEVFKKEGNNG